MSGNNVDVTRTETGWIFTKTTKDNKKAVYEVTDTNGNGRFDKGDVSTLLSNSGTSFTTAEMQRATLMTYNNTVGNEYSFDEMMGLANINTQMPEEKPEKTGFWHGVGNVFKGIGKGFMSVLGIFTGLGPNLWSLNAGGGMGFNDLQVGAYNLGTNSFMQNMPQLFNNALKAQQQYQQGWQNVVGATGSESGDYSNPDVSKLANYLDDITDGKANMSQDNKARLQEIYDEIKDDPEKFTDELKTEAKELMEAGAVPIEAANGFREHFKTKYNTPERAEKETAELLKKINNAVKKYEQMPDGEKYKIMNKKNYEELTNIVNLIKANPEKVDYNTATTLIKDILSDGSLNTHVAHKFSQTQIDKLHKLISAEGDTKLTKEEYEQIKTAVTADTISDEDVAAVKELLKKVS